MNRSAVAVVLTALLASLVVPAGAQQKVGGAKIEKEIVKKEAKGRLPAHFAKIVDDQQRERIYTIQSSYSERIEALRAQLERLEGQRDAEIRAVLTPAQRRQLDELVAEAKSEKVEKAAKKVGEAKKLAVPPTKVTAKKPG